MTIPTTPEAIDRAVAAQDDATRCLEVYMHEGLLSPASIRALLESQPREWTEETIKDAPPGCYYMARNGKTWDQVAYELGYLVEAWPDGNKGLAYGPIPHPPTGNAPTPPTGTREGEG